MSDFLFGIHPVREALGGGRRRPLELFLLRDARSPRLEEVRLAAEQAGVPVRLRDKRDLDHLAGLPHHQGVVLRVEPFPYAPLDEILARWRSSGRPALLLLLDGITDPHNFGAILRSADAAGCQGVIVPRDRSCPVTAVVEKAAAGALAYLPICQVTNLSRTLEELKSAGLWIYGLAGEAAAEPLYATSLAGDLALVVGSEGGGLRPGVRRHCDHLLAIPMLGGVASLNASVAAALALFEVARQRNVAPP
ncbi:MAG: 23S rRNA (guanosine(2251)-2'-O)-methyltransferase RlmB [Desulfuromonadales bacterium]|nr:23S rRNA (guanosine(2251)-2'-O)-methyltransferase RlmB [Desulfuromonadales bacterium]